MVPPLVEKFINFLLTFFEAIIMNGVLHQKERNGTVCPMYINYCLKIEVFIMLHVQYMFNPLYSSSYKSETV